MSGQICYQEVRSAAGAERRPTSAQMKSGGERCRTPGHNFARAEWICRDKGKIQLRGLPHGSAAGTEWRMSYEII
jgi:hypothetical protein